MTFFLKPKPADMKTGILFLLIMLPLYHGAIAQYYDLVASKNINTMLVDFAEEFLKNKPYSEDSAVFVVPVDTLWSTLEGKLDSSFITPFVFFGKGYAPFDYDFEHKIFTDSTENLLIYFRKKMWSDKFECEFIYKNKHIVSASIKRIKDLEFPDKFEIYTCNSDSLGIMAVSTNTVKEFEERLKLILPYLK